MILDPNTSSRPRATNKHQSSIILLLLIIIIHHPSQAYTYLRELQKKKSSDVLRFLARIRMWQARMEPNIKKLTRPSRTEKARGLGYKRIPGMSVVRCAVRRGGRKRPNSKGIVYGKPKHQGITQLKFKRSLRSTAEVRFLSLYVYSLSLFNASITFFERFSHQSNYKTGSNNTFRCNKVCGIRLSMRSLVKYASYIF